MDTEATQVKKKKKKKKNRILNTIIGGRLFTNELFRRNAALLALIGIIIASVVNIFMHSETLYWIISYAGILIFVGLTAYDTQEIKMMLAQHGTADDMGHKYALLGALTLYLDFVNLFLHLLRILGNRE